MQRWSNLLKSYNFSQSRQLFKPSFPKTPFYLHPQFYFTSIAINPTFTQPLKTTHFSTFQSTTPPTTAFKEAKLFLDDFSKREISDYQAVLNMLTPFKDSSNLSRKQHIIFIRVLSQIAKAYHDQLDISQALSHYKEALALAEINGIKDITELGYINNGLGAVYIALDKLDEAETCLTEANRVFSMKSRFSDSVVPIIQNICTMAILYHKEGELDKASDLFNKVLTRSVEILDSKLSASLTMIAYDGLGYINYKKMDSLKALEHWRAGLKVAISTFGEESIEVKNLYEKLAWVFFDQGQLVQALSYAERCLNIGVKHHGEGHQELSSGLSLLGQIYSKQGDYGEALETYQKLLKVLQSNPKEHQDLISDTYVLIATSYFAQGNIKQAKNAFNKAKDIVFSLYGEKSSKMVECYFAWANVLKTNQETLVTARELYYKALEICGKLNGIDKARIVDIYSYLGEIAYYQGEGKESLQLFNESLRIALSLAQLPSRLEEIYSFMGAICLQQLYYIGSTEHYENAVEACKALGNASKKLDFHYRNLGVSYERSGMLDKARDMFKKSVDVGMRTHGKDDEMTQKSVQLLLNVLLKLNKKEDAGKMQRLYVTRPRFY